MLRLSYIIPCYNMENYLPACLDSILGQGMDSSDYEVIIVNDESSDNTLALARQYAASHAHFHVIDKKNGGVGAARNSGLDRAKGKYVYFLDPDDYLARNTMPLVLSRAEKDDLDILTFLSASVGKEEYRPESSTDLAGVATMPLQISDGITFISTLKYRNEIWWYLIKREFMLENGYRFIEGKWMEDAILTAQMFVGAKKIGALEVDMHRYRILPSSAMRNKTPEHYRKVIFDNANAAHVFVGLIDSLDQQHPHFKACRKRLKTRQQSFVFFLLVRLMKSDIDIGKIRPMLRDFEAIDAYPLNQFLGADYHGFDYAFMVYIFNHKPLIEPFTRVFRFFYRLAH